MARYSPWKSPLYWFDAGLAGVFDDCGNATKLVFGASDAGEIEQLEADGLEQPLLAAVIEVALLDDAPRN